MVRFLLAFLLIVSPLMASAQRPSPAKIRKKKDSPFIVTDTAFQKQSRTPAQSADSTQAAQTSRVRILQARELEYISYKDVKDLKLVKGGPEKRVIFEHKGALLYCDSAVQDAVRNQIRAFGDVRMTQGDSLTLTGDSLFYNGNNRIATVRGRQVVMQDEKATLTTQYLDYDLDSRLGRYLNGGEIQDDSTTLTSQRGYYNSDTKMATFEQNVVMRNRYEDFQLETENLRYDTESEQAYFVTDTRIVQEGKVLNAKKGRYDTRRKKAFFEQSATVDTEDYQLEGQTVNYDKEGEQGYARKDVVLYSKKDSVRLFGQEADYAGGDLGTSVITGAPLMQKPFGSDTLYLSADTLISVKDTSALGDRLLAYRDVRIYTGELSGVCDSLVYLMTDSTIWLYGAPILWSSGSQLTADSIRILLRDSKADSMFMRENAFIVSQDKNENFNQIKGKNMVAKFRENGIENMRIDKNAESVYYVLQEPENDSARAVTMGLNKVKCGNIFIEFLPDTNQLSDISFYNQPEARFIPPHEIKEPDTRLRGFAWQADRKPVLDSMLLRMPDGYRPAAFAFQMPAALEKADALFNDKFAVYATQDTIYYFKRDCKPTDLRNAFSADFIPHKPYMLPAEDRERRYGRVTFQIPVSAIDQSGTMLYALPLPEGYDVSVLRTGQFYRPRGNRKKAPTLSREATPAKQAPSADIDPDDLQYEWERVVNLRQ